MMNYKNSVFKKCAVAKIIVAVLIISLCSMDGFSVKNVFADEKDNTSSISEPRFTLDDLRETVGKDRKFDIEYAGVLAETAGRLDLSADQLAEVTSVVGEVKTITTTDKVLKDNIASLIEKLNYNMKMGFSPSIVIDSYDSAKRAIDDYEVSYGSYLGTGEEEAAAIEKVMEAVQELKVDKSGTTVIGYGLGNSIVMPIETTGITGSIETTGFGTIFAGITDGCDIYSMFDCKIKSVDKIENNEEGLIIKFDVCDEFSFTYTGAIELDSNIKSKVDKKETVKLSCGQKIGKLMKGQWTLNVYAALDGEELDILKTMGNTGAMLKQQYINENPSLEYLTNLWEEIDAGRMITNVAPSGNVELEEIDDGSIKATYDGD